MLVCKYRISTQVCPLPRTRYNTERETSLNCLKEVLDQKEVHGISQIDISKFLGYKNKGSSVESACMNLIILSM